MKISQRIEDIFSHAAALQQSGRLRNTIYCVDSDVFVLNQDHTLLLRFRLREEESAFSNPISFDASDYDSRELEEREGRIEFLQREEGWCRTKSCKAPRFSSERVAEIFRDQGKPSGDRVTLPATILSMLDESLSHLEFSCKDGHFQIVQRNIYTGTVVKLQQESSKGSMGLTVQSCGDFDPVGLRTSDFLALFSFADAVSFWFGGSKERVHFKSDDPKVKMTGVISCCLYDELGGDFDGREESQDRGSES